MPTNPFQLLNQLQQNPIQFVLQRGFKLPQNVGNNPNDIIQHLMNTGQVSQQQYDAAMNQAKQFGINASRYK